MAQPTPRDPVRATVLDLILRTHVAGPEDPLSDEAYFLDQLRAAVAPLDTHVARLRARYGLAEGRHRLRVVPRD